MRHVDWYRYRQPSLTHPAPGRQAALGAASISTRFFENPRA